MGKRRDAADIAGRLLDGESVDMSPDEVAPVVNALRSMRREMMKKGPQGSDVRAEYGELQRIDELIKQINEQNDASFSRAVQEAEIVRWQQRMQELDDVKVRRAEARNEKEEALLRERHEALQQLIAVQEKEWNDYLRRQRPYHFKTTPVLCELQKRERVCRLGGLYTEAAEAREEHDAILAYEECLQRQKYESEGGAGLQTLERRHELQRKVFEERWQARLDNLRAPAPQDRATELQMDNAARHLKDVRRSVPQAVVAARKHQLAASGQP